MLDSVVAAFHEGHSAETIRQQYPAASLEEIYGAIAYYLAHSAEVDDYLDRQEDVWSQRRAASDQHDNTLVERLRISTEPSQSAFRRAIRATERRRRGTSAQ